MFKGNLVSFYYKGQSRFGRVVEVTPAVVLMQLMPGDRNYAADKPQYRSFSTASIDYGSIMLHNRLPPGHANVNVSH